MESKSNVKFGMNEKQLFHNQKTKIKSYQFNNDNDVLIFFFGKTQQKL